MAVTDPVADRVVVAEFDISVAETQFTNYSPFTWVAQYGPFQESVTSDFGSGCFGFGDFGGTETGNLGEKKAAIVIGSVIVDAVEYTERASIALVEANDESWYWDNAAQKLYVHFTDHKRPFLFAAITVGGISRYANKAVYIDDLFYEPRIIDPFVINKTRDPVKDLVITHDISKLDLRNADGAFDSLNQDPVVVGQPVRVYYGEVGMAFSSFDQVGKSYIDGISFDWDRVSFKLLDDRKKLSRKIPLYVHEGVEWPDIRDRHLGKPVQLVYGYCFNVPCVCLNEDAGGTPNWTMAVTDIQDYPGGVGFFEQAYVDGNPVSFLNTRPRGHINNDRLIGYFILANADFTPGQQVSVDVVGLMPNNWILYGDCELTTPPVVFWWTPTAPLRCTFARDAAQAYEGSYSYKMTATSAGQRDAHLAANATADLLRTVEDTTVTVSAYVYVPSTGGCALNECYIRVGDDDGGGFVGANSGSPSAFDTWERISITHTLRSGLTQCDIKFRMDTAASNGEFYYVDNIQVEVGSSATAWKDRIRWYNPVRLIEHLMEEYADIEYNATNFDTTEWEAAVSSSNPKLVGIVVQKRTEIKKVIEQAQTGIPLGAFMQLDNGKWTQRIYDSAASAVATIFKEDFIGVPKIKYDPNWATSVAIQFAKDWVANEFRSYLDDSEELARVGLIKKYFLHDPETMITYESAATAAAALFLAYLDKRRIVEFEIGTQLIDKDLMDVIDVEVNRINGTGLGTLTMEILGFKKDLSEGLMTIMAREIT